MRWTWDRDKAAANRAKHGVSFETAKAVFDDICLGWTGTLTQSVGKPSGWSVRSCCSSFTLRLRATKDRLDALSALARLQRVKEKPMKKKSCEPLTPSQLAELESLARLPDNAIDTSDAPEVLDWSNAKRGVFYRPVKQQLTLRLDADVVAWFKSQTKSARGYQTRINQALREYVESQEGAHTGVRDGTK
jgi:uncharacterized protein (DUF4415 family)